jgi:hypothetical protein
MAWQLVKAGHVRAVSVGYNVNPEKVTRLREGEVDGEGESQVRGPASVVNEWTLLEVSNVPVPADADAVRRSFYANIPMRADSRPGDKKEATMEGDNDGDEKPVDGEKELDASNGEHAEAVVCPQCQHSFVPGRAQEDPTPEGEEKAEAAGEPSPMTKGEKSGKVLQLRPLEALRRDAYAITPPGLQSVTARCLLDGAKNIEQVRAALKKAQADRFPPLGTPEPETRAAGMDEISDEVLERSLKQL